MEILERDVVAGFLRMCDDGWAQGWHERNGGNLTCRLLPDEVADMEPWLHAPQRCAPLGVCAPGARRPVFSDDGQRQIFSERNARAAGECRNRTGR